MGFKQYLVTERAHYMCPNMFFGIKATIKATYSIDRIKDVLLQLEDAHPFLRSVIAKEGATDKLYYAYDKGRHIPVIEKENGSLWKTHYHESTNSEWNVFQESLMKVIAISEENYTTCIFISHHLLCDGRAILSFVEEFANCYVEQKKPLLAEEHLIRSLEDLPKGSGLPFISKTLISRINKNWAKEKHQVSYDEYLTFERNFIHDNPVSYKTESISSKELESIRSSCHVNGISINDYLVTEMMVKERTSKVIIAADIRKFLPFYEAHALGNYATAFSVVCKKRSNTIWEQARIVSKEIKKIRSSNQKQMLVLACYLLMTPELIDAVAISTLGNYPSKVGNFVGSNMFGYKTRNGYSVSNLGYISNPNILDAIAIPPASPANKKTMGVLSVNGTMNKCTVTYTSTR